MKKIFTLNHPNFHPHQQQNYKIKNHPNNDITSTKDGDLLIKQIKAESVWTYKI